MNAVEQVVCMLKEARVRIQAKFPNTMDIRVSLSVDGHDGDCYFYVGANNGAAHCCGIAYTDKGETLEQALATIEQELMLCDPIAPLREQASKLGYELVPITDDGEPQRNETMEAVNA